MRTTLDLDERVVAAARSKAQHERISLGRAVSDLVLAGLAPRNVEHQRNGFPQIDTPPDHVITLELINQYRDAD